MLYELLSITKCCSLLKCFASLLPVLDSYQVNTLALTLGTVHFFFFYISKTKIT